MSRALDSVSENLRIGTSTLPATTDSLKVALVLLLLCCTVFQRFGVNFGGASLAVAVVGIFGLLLSAAWSGKLELATGRLAIYCLCMLVAVGSALLNVNFGQAGRLSLASLALLMLLHLPFVFDISTSDATQDATDLPLRIFSSIALLCAAAGIVQFYAQFLITAEWLFDFTPFIPAVIQGPSGYNTVIAVDSFYKSNGFFFREPSGFSFIMAMGLMVEWVRYKRPWRMACFALALLLSYSGSGLLTLLLGMFFPYRQKVLVRLVIFCAGAILCFWLLGDMLNLSFTLGRVGEFASDRTGSSGYIRYIAPMRFVAENIDSTGWSFLLGHGPGSISRVSQTDFQFHDPTWAKLIYEYGALGLIAFVSLYLAILRRTAMPLEIRMATFWHWLIMGGLLLNPGTAALTLAFFCWKPATHIVRRSTPSTGSPSVWKVTGINSDVAGSVQR